MILTIDIGNSNIVLGGVKDEQILFEARLRTETTKTSDQYCIDLKNMMELHGIQVADIEGSIIASVVPQVLNSMQTAVKKLTGKEALEYGVVQEVYPSEELIDKALELAQLIASKAPRSITAAKAVMNGFRKDAFAAGMARENEWCTYASRSQDCKEGMAALKEKRQPKFQNK